MKRAANGHWPWIVQAFTPRHANFPVFKSASVTHDQGETAWVSVSLLGMSRMREVQAQSRKNKSLHNSPVAAVGGKTGEGKSGLTLTLRALIAEASVASKNEKASPRGESSLEEFVPAGTHCRLLLLDAVSASKSRTGDKVLARLLEPVVLNSRVAVPAGSTFRGIVLKKIPPRRLSRPGSLRLIFTELTVAEDMRLPISASLAGAELDRQSHTRIDSEGQLHGDHPGKAWMAINLGASAGIAKEVDDGAQLLIEALISTATDASTAGTARIVSSCASGIFMATRHGRDVVLPAFTEIEVSLDRPVPLHPSSQTQIAESSDLIKQ